jgi:hypothetical protein
VWCGYLLTRPFQAKTGSSGLCESSGSLGSLKRRAQREAGFTEQRLPPCPGSGRITSWCHSHPTWPAWADTNKTIIFFLNISFLALIHHLFYENIHPSSSGSVSTMLSPALRRFILRFYAQPLLNGWKQWCQHPQEGQEA